MSNHQQQRPETSSENEKGKVHCHHVPSCTKWVHRHTRNRHWQKRLHVPNQAHGKCMRCVRGFSIYSLPMALSFCQTQIPVMPTMRVPVPAARAPLLSFPMRFSVLAVRSQKLVFLDLSNLKMVRKHHHYTFPPLLLPMKPCQTVGSTWRTTISNLTTFTAGTQQRIRYDLRYSMYWTR